MSLKGIVIEFYREQPEDRDKNGPAFDRLISSHEDATLSTTVETVTIPGDCTYLSVYSPHDIFVEISEPTPSVASTRRAFVPRFAWKNLLIGPTDKIIGYRLAATTQQTGDWFLEIPRGNVPGLSSFHIVGRNDSVGTSFVPLTIGGVYPMKQVAGAITLRVKAGGDANDTAAGSGARSVLLKGIDETGTAIEESVPTNGTSAGTASTATFIRLNQVVVDNSGTYATLNPIAASHAAKIVIEDSSGTEDWATIDDVGYGRSQAEIAFFTVPLGKKAYLINIFTSVDTTKVADIIFIQREGILGTAAPFESLRASFELSGIAGIAQILSGAPVGPFPALTDLGFLARVAAGTAEVNIEFEIILEDI